MHYIKKEGTIQMKTESSYLEHENVIIRLEGIDFLISCIGAAMCEREDKRLWKGLEAVGDLIGGAIEALEKSTDNPKG